MFKKLNLFSKTEMKLLQALLSKDAALYSAEIAKIAGVSPASASMLLRRLLKERLVVVEKKGRMAFYRGNEKNPRLLQYKVSATLDYLDEVVEKLKLVSRRVVLFGSCAEGKNTEQSDIDLFVLSAEKEKARAILRRYNKIAAIILDSSEYVALMEKDKPLYERINKGIELWGGLDGQ